MSYSTLAAVSAAALMISTPAFAQNSNANANGKNPARPTQSTETPHNAPGRTVRESARDNRAALLRIPDRARQRANENAGFDNPVSP